MATTDYYIYFAALVIASISALYAVSIWKRRSRSFREQFALGLVLANLGLLLFLLTSLWLKLLPWKLADPQTPHRLPPEISDYLSLSLLFLFAVEGTRRLHKSWDGLKSIDQYKREERAEPQSLTADALREFARIARRQQQWKAYHAHTSKLSESQLLGVSDVVAWKDRARELIRLSSSSYSFDVDLGWHDREGCWIGKNLDHDQTVLLFPARELPSQEKLARLSKYAARMSTKSSEPEVIVVLDVQGLRIDSILPYQGVRFETEDSLLTGLVDLADYNTEIRRRVSQVTLTESDLCIRDTYVAPEVYGPDGRVRKSLERYISDWLEEPGQRHLALLGEYGQGKSTTALMFTYRVLCSQEIQASRIPILVELRGTSPRNLSPLSLLGAWASKYNINPQALMHLHRAGKILLMFEGFDEMALVGDSEMRLRHFRTLWEFCYPDAKILITGRPNFFLDEEEMKAALGISKPLGSNPYCEAMRLAPFTVEQIRCALGRHKAEIRDAICTLAETNPRFRELVSRPSLLHIVSVLWERENLSDKAERLNSAYLMDLFIRFSYVRQGLKELESRDFMALTTNERAYCMSGIASFMASEQLPNQISSRQLNELIEELVQSIPDSVTLSAQAISGESNIPLRQRLEETENGLEHVKTDVRACGLLVDDPAAPGTFRFGHKSFMEYLFAAVLAEKIRDDSTVASAILRTTRAGLEDVLTLPVAIDFLGELLGEDMEGESSRQSSQSSDVLKARKLWSAILGGGRLRQMSQRFQVLVYILLRSAAEKSGAYFGFALLSLTVVLFLPMTLLVFTLESVSGAGGGAKTGVLDRIAILSAMLLMATTMMLAMSMTFSVKYSKRLLLWERLCSALSIDRSARERVSGQFLVPWARGLDLSSLSQRKSRKAGGRSEGTEDEENSPPA